MVKNIQKILVGVLMMIGLVATPLVTGSVAYAANKDSVCEGVTSIGGADACGGDGGDALGGFIKRIINILLFLIGAIAVIVIIIGGIRYVTSGGDQGSVTGAKNTILYAVVGLIVAVMAYAIVNFVVAKI